MNYLSPSILNVKNEDLERVLKELNSLECEYIHFDVMDGKFVPNTAYTSEDLAKVKEISNKLMDVHLMVSDLDFYINDFLKYKPEIITFHVEACKDEEEVCKYINLIKSHEVKAGLSIKPNTPVSALKPFIKDIDIVLVMSVEPGLGGQAFIENSLNKIKETVQLIKDYNSKAIIEVDGGIDNVKGEKCIQKGAKILVSGSYIFKSNNLKERIDSLKYEK